MPARTTEFQTIVHFVRKHTADAGITVTESKMLHDRHLDVDREVDIVIEGVFDGEPSVTSIEVIEHGRPAAVTWVEQQIAKHRYLPTNRLVLVSRSGYSKTAVRAVAAEGGWVDALRPEIVTKDGEAVVNRLYADKLEFKPTACRLFVVTPNGDRVVVRVDPDHMVCDGAGQPIDSTLRLTQEALRLEWLFRKFLMLAHNHPSREELKGFTVGLPLEALDLYLRHEESNELHHIVQVVLTGAFEFTQDEMAFTVAKVGGRVYGSGRGPLLGRDAVWVGTTDDDSKETTISWQALDATDGERAAAAKAEPGLSFPGLLEITPPADWSDVEVADGIFHVAQGGGEAAPEN
jgi:hypothetical protein